MPLKIKLQETQNTLFLMLKDLLVENLMNQSFKRILNYGLSKLKETPLMENQ